MRTHPIHRCRVARLLFPLHLSALLIAGSLPLAASVQPDFFEDYEDREVGSPEPNFPDFRSNHPAAAIEVRAETPGAELFYPGNTRYLHVESLSGINPDAPGSGTQFHGGPAGFIPFQSGTPSVVTAGFDFIAGDLHAELLFGTGEPPTSRTDDQHFTTLVRIRGELGLGNRTEVVAGPGGTDRADVQKGVPYRVEFVVNRTGAPIVYESPLGERTLENDRYDVFLFNHRSRSLQLIFRGIELQGGGARSMEGFFFSVFRYDGTGRSLDIKLNAVAVYENHIVLSGGDSVPPGPATALVDFNDLEPAIDTRSPLWDLPGNVVADTEGLFGDGNGNFFHVDRRTFPEFLSSKFRFNDVVPLLSFGMDIMVHRDEVINSFSDGHDDVALNITGGDTIANVEMTLRLHVRGTRSVGNEGDPSQSSPQLVVFQEGSAQQWSNGFEWETPYRLEAVLNQTGGPVVYNTPWADGITLPNEHLHVYLYNLATRENVALAHGREEPYVIEGAFNMGVINPTTRAGTMADFFFKHVPARPMDFSLDNVAFFENVAVVSDPGAVVDAPPRIIGVSARKAVERDFQPHLPDRFTISFESRPGLLYNIEQSGDLSDFTDLRSRIPADSTRGFTEVELPLGSDAGFFRLFPVLR